MASMQGWDDHECQGRELGERICCRSKHPDRGSDSAELAPSRRRPSAGWQSIPRWAALRRRATGFGRGRSPVISALILLLVFARDDYGMIRAARKPCKMAQKQS